MLFFLMIPRPPRSTRTDTLFPDTTLFRSRRRSRKGGCRNESGMTTRRHPRMRRELTAWTFVAPALAALGLFFALPVAAALLLSFTVFDFYALADPGNLRLPVRSEESRVGNERVSTWRSRCPRYHQNNTNASDA